MSRISWMALFGVLTMPVCAIAISSPAVAEEDQSPNLWHYGAYLDLSYILNFNFPENHLWRNRSTAAPSR